METIWVVTRGRREDVRVVAALDDLERAVLWVHRSILNPVKDEVEITPFDNETGEEAAGAVTYVEYNAYGSMGAAYIGRQTATPSYMILQETAGDMRFILNDEVRASREPKI